ncbi:TauD/TfdA dioxygenase family protein [Ilumatobacter sp.]|uniref:TauD/TfdA dioxygenase family protein n=1 Tax=Ilumatobacter sp. TaxID=1967498 RepID=UPI003AF6C15E
MPFQITRLSAALGAEVRGVDLDDVTPQDVAEISEHLVEHLVLFFPDQELSLDGHVGLGRRFGELEIHPNLPNAGPDHPEVLQLRATRGGVADEWHTDVTFLPSPSVMSIMHMVTCPELGGDTMWANQYLAYERLSAPLRELVDGLHAVHNASPHRKPEMTAMHPVVRIHPETGRRSLMVNEHFTKRIAELSHPESRVLLDYLVRWSTSDEFVVRYRWSPGTVAIWDNRCTQHRVIHDFDGERIIQRVTVLGDRPEGSAPRWEPFATERFGATSVHDDILRNHLREHVGGLAPADDAPVRRA